MEIDLTLLNAISGNNKYATRKEAFAAFINTQDLNRDVLRPHDFALFISQLMIESGRFRYTKEIWGPTAAQKRYQTHPYLGNTMPGDGKRFMGRGLIQVTGRANYQALTDWCGGDPDFIANYSLLEQDDWAGVSALWYWSTRVEKRFKDAGNVEMITRRINGGLNHFKERLQAYDKAALAILGYDDILLFQGDQGLVVDGVSGPQTRAAFHKALVAHGAKPKRKVWGWWK